MTGQAPGYPPAIIPCMPDGRLAPHVMTQAELIEFLRLEVKFPRKVIKGMRDNGLAATQVSKHVRFLLPDVLAFLESEKGRVVR